MLRILEDVFDVEILPRHREPEQLPDWLDHADLEPSWGPWGSLAKSMLSAAEYARLVDLTEEMNRRERAARVARGEHLQPPSEPAPVEPPKEPRVRTRGPRASQRPLQPPPPLHDA